ncbi:MAG: MFS transporter [Steroidobacteraceae bacterium]
MLEPIKHDLRLTDTELGALSGFAFGVFYAIAGIPIGILADRIERRRIIALAVGVWSLMTASCGLTTSFWQLFAARVAVGAAESGGPPASISLITDLYTRRSRASAIALYMSGSSVALVLAYAMGSWVASRWGWRAGFLAAGVPGLILALLVWATFSRRRGSQRPGK